MRSKAFRLDLSVYYWGVVEVPFNHGEEALFAPPFSPPSGVTFSWLMSTYNRRFAQMARKRRLRDVLGKTNRGNRCLIPGFSLKRSDTLRLFPMLAEWFKLETKEGWRSWGESSNEREQSQKKALTQSTAQGVGKVPSEAVAAM